MLKRFGAGNQAPLSFPQPGWTLTVDFPIEPGLHRFCDELDELVLEAGRPALPGEGVADHAVRPSSGATPGSRSGARSATRPTPTAVFVSDMARRLELTGR